MQSKFHKSKLPTFMHDKVFVVRNGMDVHSLDSLIEKNTLNEQLLPGQRNDKWGPIPIQAATTKETENCDLQELYRSARFIYGRYV